MQNDPGLRTVLFLVISNSQFSSPTTVVQYLFLVFLSLPPLFLTTVLQIQTPKMLSLALTITAIVYAAIILLVFIGFSILLHFQKLYTREHLLSTFLTSYSVLFWAVSFGVACPVSQDIQSCLGSWVTVFQSFHFSEISSQIIVINNPWQGLAGYEDRIEDLFVAYIMSNSVAQFIKIQDHVLFLKNHWLSKYLAVKIAMGASPFLGFFVFYSFGNYIIFESVPVNNPAFLAILLPLSVSI